MSASSFLSKFKFCRRTTLRSATHLADCSGNPFIPTNQPTTQREGHALAWRHCLLSSAEGAGVANFEAGGCVVVALHLEIDAMLENEPILRIELRVLVVNSLALEGVPLLYIFGVNCVEVPDHFETTLYDVRVIVRTDPSSKTVCRSCIVTSEGALRRPCHLPCWSQSPLCLPEHRMGGCDGSPMVGRGHVGMPASCRDVWVGLEECITIHKVTKSV